jgi:hypothetical protein
MGNMLMDYRPSWNGSYLHAPVRASPVAVQLVVLGYVGRITVLSLRVLNLPSEVSELSLESLEVHRRVVIVAMTPSAVPRMIPLTPLLELDDLLFRTVVLLVVRMVVVVLHLVLLLMIVMLLLVVSVFVYSFPSW